MGCDGFPDVLRVFAPFRPRLCGIVLVFRGSFLNTAKDCHGEVGNSHGLMENRNRFVSTSGIDGVSCTLCHNELNDLALP
jgi:hypothetical protein